MKSDSPCLLLALLQSLMFPHRTGQKKRGPSLTSCFRKVANLVTGCSSSSNVLPKRPSSASLPCSHGWTGRTQGPEGLSSVGFWHWGTLQTETETRPPPQLGRPMASSALRQARIWQVFSSGTWVQAPPQNCQTHPYVGCYDYKHQLAIKPGRDRS